MSRIAVVGAGLAGLVAARALDTEHEVTVFEKSRGFGGRMATRTVGGFQFDHGAQFFTARSREFSEFLAPLLAGSLVQSWNGRFAEFVRGRRRMDWTWDDQRPHFVAVPGMNALGKALANKLDVRLDTTVAAARREAGGWTLLDTTQQPLGRFEWLVLALPAQQAASLLPESSCLHGVAATRQMTACFALLLGFAEPLAWPWHAARVRDADISWISRDNSKPGRPATQCLVVHSTNAWADTHLESSLAAVREHLLAETMEVMGQDLSVADHIDLHRWRYANIARQPPGARMVDGEQQLAVCGDWLVHGRVEGAFLSAQRMLEELRGAMCG